MPQPNFTIDTLVKLEEKHGADYRFALIMGADNLMSFHKWKNYEVILENYGIYIYPRVSGQPQESDLLPHKNIHLTQAPIMEVSSTFIRKQHKEGKNIRPMLPDAVWKFMDEMNFYR